MKYVSKTVNGFDTRNKFIRSMDLAHATSADEALTNYCNEWFSSQRKEYLTQAFRMVCDKQFFWPVRAVTEMLDEIYVFNSDNYDEKEMAQDVDLLKGRYNTWASHRKNQPITSDAMLKYIKDFEKKYKYECPDSFKFYWMNNGAFITLNYAIKCEGITFPGFTQEESLSKLKGFALEVIEDHNHDMDTRLFDLCHFLYSQRLNAI